MGPASERARGAVRWARGVCECRVALAVVSRVVGEGVLVGSAAAESDHLDLADEAELGVVVEGAEDGLEPLRRDDRRLRHALNQLAPVLPRVRDRVLCHLLPRDATSHVQTVLAVKEDVGAVIRWDGDGRPAEPRRAHEGAGGCDGGAAHLEAGHRGDAVVPHSICRTFEVVRQLARVLGVDGARVRDEGISGSGQYLVRQRLAQLGAGRHRRIPRAGHGCLPGDVSIG